MESMNQPSIVDRAQEAIASGLDNVRGKARIAMLLAMTAGAITGCNNNDGTDMGGGEYDTAGEYDGEVTDCSDGEDNDGDGLTDATDPQCWNADGVPDGSMKSEAAECDNGEDDDGDYYTDYYNTEYGDGDLECANEWDTDEATWGAQYPDGWDAYYEALERGASDDELEAIRDEILEELLG